MRAPSRSSASTRSPRNSASSPPSMASVSTSSRANCLHCWAAQAAARPRLLRMLAGFEIPTAGRILIDGQDMSAVPPYERPVNMMFQSYALFPHMTVEKNVGYGLKHEALTKAEVHDRVEELLELVQLQRPRRPQAAPAFRRPAPARGAGPGARQEPQAVVAGRAAGGAGQEIARADPVRTDEHPGKGRRHLHRGHPRPGRSDDPGQPHRRHGPRAYMPDRHAHRDLRIPAFALRRRLHRFDQSVRGHRQGGEEEYRPGRLSDGRLHLRNRRPAPGGSRQVRFGSRYGRKRYRSTATRPRTGAPTRRRAR